MADEAKNPFLEGFEGDLVEPKPLDWEQRFIISNFFDTQPKRRAAYLKKLGYELDPDDPNKYRPLNSDRPFTAEIDPGVFSFFKLESFADQGLELVWDVMDSGYDLLPANALSSAGATGLGAAGTATGAALGGLTGLSMGGVPGMIVGAFTGGVALGVGGLIAGGAVGNYAAEELKEAIGDTLLDESIPADKTLQVTQSLLVGMAPVVFRAVRQGLKFNAKQETLLRRKALVNAAKTASGNLDDKVIERAAMEPELFSDEAVKNATPRLTTMFREIFGLDDPTQVRSPDQIREGLFRKAMDPLNKQAKEDIERLATDPRADFSIGELTAPFRAAVGRLSNKFDRSKEEDAALAYLRKKLKKLEVDGKAAHIKRFGEDGAIKAPVENYRINFKQAREFLGAIQDDIFEQDKLGNLTMPGAASVAQAVGGGEEGLRTIMDKKVMSLRSQFPDIISEIPEINAKKSHLMRVYNNLHDNLNKSTLLTAFIGKDDATKEAVRMSVRQMDQLLGTPYEKAIETGQIQRAVEDLFRNKRGFGSGAVVADALQGAKRGFLKGAGAGGMAGAVVGHPVAGMLAGGVGGGLKGAADATALSSPQRAIEAIRNSYAREQSLNADLARPLLQQITPYLNPIKAPKDAALGAAGIVAGKGAASFLPTPTPEPSASPKNPFLEGFEEDLED